MMPPRPRLRAVSSALALLPALLFLSLLPARADTQAALRDHLLVVYNEILPESASLAKYYASARGIPDDRVFGVRCPITEEITRKEYKEQIEEPLRSHMIKEGWMALEPGLSPFGDQTLPIQAAKFNNIWCIVLMRGVPLKIAHDPSVQEVLTPTPQLNTNAAAVDSELSLLPLVGLPLIGVIDNPYYLLGYNRPFDGLDARQMIMVGRLDGPTANDVRRVIDDSLYAEKNRLAGRAFVDARGLQDETSGYYPGDEDLLNGAELLYKEGWDLDIDKKPDVYADNLPWRDVALYAGWYKQDASGPFMRDVKPSVFVRGAVAYHIHSFSASTLRSDKSNWCGPLISKGAAATMGAVYEPYLGFMPHWDIFIRRLLQGGSFIESGYGSQRVLSWMTVFVGDPLYTPFAVPLDKAIARSPAGSDRHDFLLLQDVRTSLALGRIDETRQELNKMIAEPKLTHVGWEGYADLLSDSRLMPPNSTVADAYEHAFNLSGTLEDQIRTNLKAAQAFENRFRDADAKRLLNLMLSRYPNESVAFGVQDYLKKVNAGLGIPSPSNLDSKLPQPPPKSAVVPASSQPSPAIPGDIPPAATMSGATNAPAPATLAP